MSRTEKVGQEIKKEISTIIQNELSDPRLGFITIMGVEVTKDLQIAKVYFSVMGTDQQKEKAAQGLSSAAGFIRRLIGERLKLRLTPEIIFKIDNSVSYSIDIAQKIERIKDELKKNNRTDKEA